MAYTTALPTSINIKFNNITPPKTIDARGELTITWDLVNETQVYYDLNTSNCGMCPTTTLSNSAVCNLTSDVQDDVYTLCNVTVIIQVMMECDGVSEQYYSESVEITIKGEIYNELNTYVLIYVLA